LHGVIDRAHARSNCTNTGYLRTPGPLSETAVHAQMTHL